MDSERYLIISADDYGIGPATSRAILDLAAQKRITATVLLVNSPHAEAAVREWRQAGKPVELGWHPCLTLDQPILPAERVPSLVDAQGRFWSLGRFMTRICLGLIRNAEIEAELRAQFGRFHDLAGHPPTVVNSHHHIQVFAAVGTPLLQLLNRRRRLPYVRRIREPWRTLARVPGARAKRAFLSILGRRDAHRQQRSGFPGNDWLAGITNPICVADPEFFQRWLTHVSGAVVELTCHPGYLDETLIGRDCTANDGQLLRRVREFELLRQPIFQDACRKTGRTLISPSEWANLGVRKQVYAA